MGVLGDQGKVPAQLDHAGQLAPVLDGAADRFGVGSSTVNMPAIQSAAMATDIRRRAGCIGPWRPRARPAGSLRTSGSATGAGDGVRPRPIRLARPDRVAA
jgi:hypothetical protein